MNGLPDRGGPFRGMVLRYEVLEEPKPGSADYTVLLSHEIRDPYPGERLLLPRLQRGARDYMGLLRDRLTVVVGTDAQVARLGDFIRTYRYQRRAAPRGSD